MPRVSRKQADLNREAITRAAARLYRERGFDGVGIPQITQAAGLTHGSFYGHFDSKGALAAEASAAAFQAGFARWEQRREGAATPAAARAAFIVGYLSRRNRDTPGDACPMAALAVDVGRQPPGAPVRSVFHDGIGVILEKLISVQAPGSVGAVEQRALTDLAAMVGALILARATLGSALSDKFLDGVGAELRALRPAPADGQKNEE